VESHDLFQGKVCYVDFIANVEGKWLKGSTRVPAQIGLLLRSSKIETYAQGIRRFAPMARGSLVRNKKATDFPEPFDHRTLFPFEIRGPYDPR
jgi:hypothetical protein